MVDLHVRVPVVAIPYLAENAGYSPMNLGHNILDSITPPEERAVVNLSLREAAKSEETGHRDARAVYPSIHALAAERAT